MLETRTKFNREMLALRSAISKLVNFSFATPCPFVRKSLEGTDTNPSPRPRTRLLLVFAKSVKPPLLESVLSLPLLTLVRSSQPRTVARCSSHNGIHENFKFEKLSPLTHESLLRRNSHPCQTENTKGDSRATECPVLVGAYCHTPPPPSICPLQETSRSNRPQRHTIFSLGH